jgi:hypothetical protein
VDDEHDFDRGGCGERSTQLGASLSDISCFLVEITLDEAFDEVEDNAFAVDTG